MFLGLVLVVRCYDGEVRSSGKIFLSSCSQLLMVTLFISLNVHRLIKKNISITKSSGMTSSDIDKDGDEIIKIDHPLITGP